MLVGIGVVVDPKREGLRAGVGWSRVGADWSKMDDVATDVGSVATSAALWAVSESMQREERLESF